MNIRTQALKEYQEHLYTTSVGEDDLLYLKGVDSLCLNFKESFVPILLEKINLCEWDGEQKQQITEENVKDFLKKFRLVNLPSNEEALEQAIQSKVVDLGLVEKYDSSDYARHLNKKVIEWYDKSSRYLPPLGAKTIFCDLKTDKVMARLDKMEIEFKSDELLLSTVRILHLIPQNNKVLTLLKVHKFLKHEELKMLFLSTAESSKYQRLVAESFLAPGPCSLVVYVTKEVEEVQELYARIAEALDKFEYKRVILIGDYKDRLAEQFKKYNENAFKAMEDNVTFMDFEEKSQEELLKRAILFREASL